jgi:hypothetical protein
MLVQNVEQAIVLFGLYLSTPEAASLLEAAKVELGGRNLACWCKAGQACHGDILLRAANGGLICKDAA